MANKNASLGAAKASKQDEFYTQLSDIEKELVHYREHFRDKVVFCNCDDPYESNFFKYFALNFNALGLKKLIATCYDGSPIAQQELQLFPEETTEPKRKAYKVEISEVPDLDGNGATDLTDVQLLLKSSDHNVKAELKGNGDFRSSECVEMLKQADIVVTNPPFSLFREYIALLVKYDKKFLIIGNQNALTYKEIFPLIKANKVWLGCKFGDMSFQVPSYFEPRATRYWVDDRGQKWRSLGNVCWFTNLDHSLRHEELILIKKYNPDDYPTYDNYNDVINIDKVADIPYDYKGIMGVPITFLGSYNPDQFDIISASDFAIDDIPGWHGVTEEFYKIYYAQGNKGQIKVGWPLPYYVDKDGRAIIPYKRVLIRNKKPQIS